MGLQNYRVYFDNPQAVYFCGDTISGRVEVELNSIKKINGISITFKGEARTSWSEDTTTRNNEGRDETTTTYYNGHESYFHTKYWLTGGSGAIELPPGHHVYSFSIQLPNNIPSSFEGSYGHVRYTVKSTLDRPWKFDQTIKAAFTVLAPLDLNLYPQLRNPSTKIMEKTFCCCLCTGGNISAIAKIPFAGFVCGQIIPITIEIDNVSTVNIAGFSVKLLKNVTFYTTSLRDTKSFSISLQKKSFNKTVLAKKSDLFSLHVQIPVVPPSNLSNCRIIDISYCLRFKFFIIGLHRDLVGYLPITIGTVPFTNMMPMSQPIRLNPSAPNVAENELRPSASAPPSYDSIEQSSAIGWVPAPPGSPDAHDIPPPTYEESQFGAKNILDKEDSKHTMLNNAHYAPMYPVYNFNSPN